MSELSPQAEARDVELATTKGAALCGRPRADGDIGPYEDGRTMWGGASRTRRGPPMEKTRAKTWTVRRKKYGSGRNKLWKMLDFSPLMWYSTSVT